jgi:hypothetical protein
MAVDVDPLTLVNLATLKPWLKMAQASVVSGSSTTGATVGNASQFAPNQAITWITAAGVVSGTSFLTLVNGNALTWAPAFTGTPAVGDFITEGTRDQQLILLLNSLSNNLEISTGRYFKPRSVSETFTGDGRNLFIANYAPIVSVQSIVVDGIPVVLPNYFVAGLRGYIKLQSGYSFSNNSIGNCLVTYTAGYDDVTFKTPSSASLAILQMAKVEYDRWQTGGISADALHLGQAGLSTTKNWPKHIQDLVEHLTDRRKMFMSTGY